MENTENATSDKPPAKSGNDTFRMILWITFFVVLRHILEIWLTRAAAAGITIWAAGLSFFLDGVIKEKRILRRRAPWILVWTVTVAVLTFAAERFGWF